MKQFVVLSMGFGLFASLGCESETGDACASDATGVQARMAAESTNPGEFWSQPWPSDARLRTDGTLQLINFPNPTASTTLEDYLTAIQDETPGFGKSSAVYVHFTGAIDPRSLPADPVAATRADASVYLLDVDPDSPERGRRYPLAFHYAATKTTFRDDHSLAILPPYGLTLRDGTTYAVVGTDAVKTPAGASIVRPETLQSALTDGCEDRAPAKLKASLAPLVEELERTGAEAIDRIRFATVFTTRDSVAEIRTIGDAARAEPVVEIQDLRLDCPRHGACLTLPGQKAYDGPVNVLIGEIQMPAFQSGTVPYSEPRDGGRMNFDADGKLTRTHTETTRISIALPRFHTMPANGWPVVLFSHGTGGSFRDALDDEVADRLAAFGIAAVGYDQVLHGPRDPTGADESVTFFNLFNIVAGRDNVRQGAADLVVMTKLIQNLRLEARFGGVGATEQRFDVTKIGFLGHSQGGLVGAPFVATEPAIKAAVFSGTSGVLTITLLERKDPVDFVGVLRSLLRLPAEEVLDDFHPVLNVLQTFIDPADPISYARSYLEDPPGGVGKDILFIEGFKDFASPARGHEALASAARAPLVTPHHRVPYASTLIGLTPLDAPVSGNGASPSGPVTIGLLQYPEQTHFPIYNDEDATTRYLEFMRSSLLDGRATIVAPIAP